MISAKELQKKTKIAQAEKKQKIINEVSEYMENKIASRLLEEAKQGNFHCNYTLHDLSKEHFDTFVVLMNFEGYQVTIDTMGVAHISW